MIAKYAIAGVAGTALLASAALIAPVAAQSPSIAPVGSPIAPIGSPGTGGDQPHPARIHRGTCADLGDVVAPLRDITVPKAIAGSASGAVEMSVSRIDLTIPQMLRNPHALNAHLSEAQIGTSIACGEVVGRRNDRNLVIELQEQNASGYRGAAFLQADGDRTIVFTVLFDPAAISGGIGSPVASPAPASLAPLESLPPVVTPPTSPLPSASTTP